MESKEFDKMCTDEIQRSFPWKADGIYLQDAQKQIKAVCQNNDIAKIIEYIVDFYHHQSSIDQTNRINLYKKFIEDSYCLYIAMNKAKIPVNSIETIILQKAYENFCLSMRNLFQTEHIGPDRFEQIKQEILSKQQKA